MQLITIQTEDGQELKITLDFVKAFGVEEIRKIDSDRNYAIPLHIESNHSFLNGVHEPNQIKVSTNVEFHEPTTVYSLVEGGWLPPPLAKPSRFLVDRNVISRLRSIRENKVSMNERSFKWWMDLFTSKDTVFHPLPYAFESKFKRKPTFLEFCQAYDKAVYELRQFFPGCRVVEFSTPHYDAAYKTLEDLDDRNAQETRFLIHVCPLVAHRVSSKNVISVKNHILKMADSFHLKRNSLAVLTVLSCLYENIHGTPVAIGRQIIKPKETYSELDAFNALSDLRHVEIAALSKGILKDEGYWLCTCDKALALLWSSLAISPSLSDQNTLTVNFNSDLFSRLNLNELESLKTELCS